jgi:glutamate-1-semialdehyde 2,1-aminomutase
MPHLDAARRRPERSCSRKIVDRALGGRSGTCCRAPRPSARAQARPRVHGRSLFIRFDGHYHGWLDNVFGGGVDPDPQGPPYALYREEDLFNSKGRDKASEKQSFKLPWNEIDVLERTLERYGEQVALVIMEGINANGGSCWPKPGYLERVRELCDQYGIVLCLDEIITGFRWTSAAQKLLGVTPDLTTFGKGSPAASRIRRRRQVGDHGPVRRPPGHRRGTFNGYPLGVAAGLATDLLEQDGGVFTATS